MDTNVNPGAMFDLPNTGLRFLFDEEQAQHSAQIKLQWCLDSGLTAYLRERNIKDPLLFISVTNPAGREKRYIVALWQMQELVQFHRAGTHKIYGRILWRFNNSLSEVRKSFLKKDDPYTFRWDIDQVKSLWNSIGNADLQIEVPSEFFAKELSASETWWLGLWLGELWDECNIRRRRLFAYTIQLLLVGIWVFLKCSVRVLVASFLSGVLLQRKVHWEVVLHPFDYRIVDVWGAHYPSRREWTDRIAFSRILREKNGNERPYEGGWLWLLCPPLHILLLVIAGGVGWVTSGQPSLLATLEWYLILFAGLSAAAVLFVIAVILLAGMMTAISNMWGPRKAPVPKAPRQQREPSYFELWLKEFGERVAHALTTQFDKLDVYLTEKAEAKTDRLYSGLQCDTAPTTGLRPLAVMPIGIARIPRILYQDIKARVCKPMARG
jgi:hypothetical protein